MFDRQSRRDFVKMGVGLASSMAGGTLLASTACATRASVRPPATGLRMRRNALTPGGLADLADYRKAVGIMKSLPDSDRRSWIFQANMHGVPSGQGTNPLWAQCQHGTAYFLPWHRWYVYYFEDIIRGLLKNDDFALPFWPYQADSTVSLAATRILPEPFRAPADASNPLWISERDPDVNAGQPFRSSDAYSAGSLGLKSFLVPPPPGFGGFPVGPQHDPVSFGGLESNPHNNVHMAVGGWTAGGWMTDPDWAARDPIFWVHHANIDRLWFVWNQRGNPNPASSVTGFDLGHTFQYVDRTGSTVTKSVESCFTTEALGYTYEPVSNDPPAPAPRVAMNSLQPEAFQPQGTLLAMAPPPVTLGGSRVDVRIAAAAEGAAHLEALRVGRGTGRVVLFIQGLKVDRKPKAGFEVYLNLPEGDRTPDAARTPHYVGNLSFFGVSGPGGGHAHHGDAAHDADAGYDYAFDITDVVSDLGRKNLVAPDGFTISLVPYAGPGQQGDRIDIGANVTFRSASVRTFKSP